METRKEDNQKETIEKYARNIMQLAKDTITVRFRFFDTALGKLKLISKPGLMGFATNGAALYYDPALLLQTYMDEPNVAVRLFLHVLLHQVFLHPYRYEKTNEDYWNMACDIAVENIILEMDLPAAALTRDDEQRGKIQRIRKWCPELTADKLYREFMVGGVSSVSQREYVRLFAIDSHDAWRSKKEEMETVITQEQWEKISERVKADLKTFSKNKTGSESLDTNIEEATKKRYDYASILERFAVLGEEMMVNDDEFDYIYYTYGLSTYKNLPLIEPLEYKETNKIKEFVIAIDTSASCRGKVVKAFLQTTYDILKQSENFFLEVNIHIVQCDATIRQDTKITCEADFRKFLETGKLTGFGATDFRPVFQYVEELKEEGEFENLKGLIYFTDGYGIYPEHMPDYDVIFAFLGEDSHRMPVPVWAIQVILEDHPEND
ncbi:MAG: VWA-like domain-containing protein [Lachnospiraceae bacterium]